MTRTPAFTERDFHKASASNPHGDCVQVARRGARVEIRDGKTDFGGPDDHRLVCTAEQFDRFLAGVRADPPAGEPGVTARPTILTTSPPKSAGD